MPSHRSIAIATDDHNLIEWFRAYITDPLGCRIVHLERDSFPLKKEDRDAFCLVLDGRRLGEAGSERWLNDWKRTDPDWSLLWLVADATASAFKSRILEEGAWNVGEMGRDERLMRAWVLAQIMRISDMYKNYEGELVTPYGALNLDDGVLCDELTAIPLQRAECVLAHWLLGRLGDWVPASVLRRSLAIHDFNPNSLISYFYRMRKKFNHSAWRIEASKIRGYRIYRQDDV